MKQILRPFSKTFATNYMCCSELAGRWLFGDKEYNEGNVYLLNNAIDIDKFKFNEEMRKKARKELNISEDKLVIGHIGRFVETKNHSFLIDIFREIYKRNNDSMLLLLGQGPKLEEIKEKVRKYNLQDNVLFLGQRNDANRLYQVFDTFLLPSLYEGLPVVGVEAQASGLPCLFSKGVTKEAKVLNTTQFVSLDNSAEVWADKTIQFTGFFQRVDATNEITKNNFNINNEAQKIEIQYTNLLKKK